MHSRKTEAQSSNLESPTRFKIRKAEPPSTTSGKRHYHGHITTILATTVALTLAASLDITSARSQPLENRSTGIPTVEPEWPRMPEYEIKEKDNHSLTQEIINRALADSDKAKESGNYDEAEKISEMLLKQIQDAYGGDHPYTAVGLLNLAKIYAVNKSTDSAISMFDKAAAIYEEENGIGRANLLSETASMLLINGQIEKARYRALEAIKIHRKMGERNARTGLAWTMITLANIYAAAGQSHQSLDVLREARKIAEGNGDIAILARVDSNLSRVYHGLGMLVEARKHLKDARIGIHSVEIDLQEAMILIAEKRYAESIALLENLTKDSLVAKMSAAKASVRRTLADAYALNRDYKSAIRLLQDSASFAVSVLGEKSPAALNARSALAQAYYLDENYAASKQEQEKFANTLQIFFRSQFPYLSRIDQANLKRQYASSISTSYQLSAIGDDGLKHALETAIRFKGIILDIERREQLVRRGSPETRVLIEQISTIKKTLSSEILNTQATTALRRRLDALEREIEISRTDEDPGLSELGDILKLLPQNSALIEYIEYSPYDAHKKQRLAPIYIAILATSDASFHRIELGSKLDIDKSINEAINALSENQSDAGALLEKVADLTVAPLLKYTMESETLIFVPDGELSRVPFMALPDPASKNRLLSKSKNISILTSSRDIAKEDPPHTPNTKSLVIVDPDYNLEIDSTHYDSNTFAAVTRGTSPERPLWAKLPATRNEGIAVSGLLDASMISGQKATKKAVLEVNRPKVLHVATHGFFTSATTDAKGKEIDHKKATSKAQKENIEDYLDRNGLVFAGANRLGKKGSDSYLTAKEATGLNLSGTELVVLSACSTANGITQSGEGVYGLQRALKVAGAHSTLLSLWKVDDNATASFMERFYSYLKAGESRRDAVKLAQLEFRSGVQGDGKWTDPYYWAAWQLVGDWRPIEGL